MCQVCADTADVDRARRRRVGVPRPRTLAFPRTFLCILMRSGCGKNATNTHTHTVTHTHTHTHTHRSLQTNELHVQHGASDRWAAVLWPQQR